MITCIFEDGAKTSLRHVTVSSLSVNEKGQILLIKRAAHMLNGGKYGIPGGFLDRDEDTKKAALRELHEETGYKGEIVSLFQIIDTPHRPKEDRQNVEFRYVVKIIDGEIAPDNETESVGWFSEHELPEEDKFAFDHRATVVLYFQYLKKSFPLPVI